jgi:hypothetical protein
MRFKWGCLEGQAISVSDTVVKNPMTSHERRKEQVLTTQSLVFCVVFCRSLFVILVFFCFFGIALSCPCVPNVDSVSGLSSSCVLCT